MHKINKIKAPFSWPFPKDTRGLPGIALSLEKAGDVCTRPGRVLFGREYTVKKLPNGKLILKSPEQFLLGDKIAAVVLFPFTLIATLFGLLLKSFAHYMSPELADKYSLPTLINAREKVNFCGKLPENPWTPNCVNTQKKSFWGKLYNAEPIAIPDHVKDPIKTLKEVLRGVNEPGLKASNFNLVEETSNYLHYTYTVVIPSGPLKGTYIDDVDIHLSSKRGFDIRSASRVGFRDAVHANFKLPGANKKRIEAIRQAFAKACSAEKEKAAKASIPSSLLEKTVPPLATAKNEILKDNIPSPSPLPEVRSPIHKEPCVTKREKNAETANAPKPAASTTVSLPSEKVTTAKAPSSHPAESSSESCNYRPLQTPNPIYFVRDRRIRYVSLVDQIILRAKMLIDQKRNGICRENDILSFLKRHHFIDSTAPRTSSSSLDQQKKPSTLLNQFIYLSNLLLENVEEDKTALDLLKSQGKLFNHREKGERGKFMHFIHHHLVDLLGLIEQMQRSCLFTHEEQKDVELIKHKMNHEIRDLIRWK